MTDSGDSIDQLCINTIRTLSVDMVQQANSGHPGLPLGTASMAYVLWTRFLKFNPRNPNWPNRDRFILSAGHGSALQYALLHLSGYDLSIEEIKRFRQWESKTPGHPEYGLTPGIEATTGPLGQGFAMGVGMAIAERFLASDFNRPGFPIVDHHIYAIVSDGDLMEGVSSEAASLAGYLKLGKMIYLYDDNKISIEGSTNLTFTENVGARFQAYGWHVTRVSDGNDIEAIQAAIDEARRETNRPSLVIVRTHIGYGSPKQDSASAHGEPLGEPAVKATKERLNWPTEARFYIPEEVTASFRLCGNRGQEHEQRWNLMLEDYSKTYPEAKERFLGQFRGDLPDNWDSEIPVFKPEDKPEATRVSSGKVLNGIAKKLPNIIGGSADLAPSTKTIISGDPAQSPDQFSGRNIHFGVREFAMGAIVNGMALHGGVIPYGATFFVFTDYMRPAIRLAAIMNIHSIFVLTHDSVALGEDGPTHQPVEHLASLRAMPNLCLIRPADANETAEAWRLAIKSKGPVALILTRQSLPVLDRKNFASASLLERGAYVLSDSQKDPSLIMIASGSEVNLALKAQDTLLKEHNIATRVVSMPSWDLFEKQSREYIDEVLPPRVEARLAIEAGASFGWERWVGLKGKVISIDKFGASAPGPEVLSNYGFNVENVVKNALEVARNKDR
ncbi:MAG: transketolase [Deltaproteobacteria bacterium]|nr:transketolase [Deltaproteobacteria bacterium]